MSSENCELGQPQVGAGNETIKMDRFCWVCHEPNPILKCRKCPRAYHCLCVSLEMPGYPKPKIIQLGGIVDINEVILLECPECILWKYVFNRLTPLRKKCSREEIRRILTTVITALNNTYKKNPFIDIVATKGAEYTATVAKVVDITSLKNMILSEVFETLEGFMGEVKWILHNSVIFDGVTSQAVRQCREIVKLCLVELRVAFDCPDCYLSSISKNSVKDSSWFINTCKPPHILAWSKYGSEPWWPSKVLATDGNKVKVMFFGDITWAELSYANCRLYSCTAPKKKSKDTPLMTKAVRQIQRHIEELEKVYGTVTLAEDSKSPMVKQLDLESLKVMFPDFDPPSLH